MEYSLATLMLNIVNDEKLNMEKTILHHKEGVDLIPANIELSAIEVSLVNAMSRELIMRSLVERLREFYDFIIIDCMPSLGMMTINALACADSVLIPVQAAYLPVKGLQQLIKTIGRVKKQLNSKLRIEGILLTMVDNRTNYARDVCLRAGAKQEPIVSASTELHQVDLVSAGTLVFDLASVPAYSGQPYAIVNDNKPYFTDADLTAVSFETYSDLDSWVDVV